MLTDILNFPVIPTEQKTLKSKLRKGGRVSRLELDPRSREALMHVQHVLLLALQSYWLPCYLCHVLDTQPFPILEVSREPVDRGGERVREAVGGGWGVGGEREKINSWILTSC